jgi:hypothetical protein
MMKATAPLLALAIFAIAPSAALADPVRFPTGFAIVAAAVLLLTLHLTRHTHIGLRHRAQPLKGDSQ